MLDPAYSEGTGEPNEPSVSETLFSQQTLTHRRMNVAEWLSTQRAIRGTRTRRWSSGRLTKQTVLMVGKAHVAGGPAVYGGCRR